MDSGIIIDYRCIRCRTCNECKNADQTERVSLGPDAEDEMIEKSVSLDYEKKEIFATLPLRGNERDFLAPNEERAHCVLNQRCRRCNSTFEIKCSN